MTGTVKHVIIYLQPGPIVFMPGTANIKPKCSCKNAKSRHDGPQITMIAGWFSSVFYNFVHFLFNFKFYFVSSVSKSLRVWKNQLVSFLICFPPVPCSDPWDRYRLLHIYIQQVFTHFIIIDYLVAWRNHWIQFR